jgi:hypothetical protein
MRVYLPVGVIALTIAIAGFWPTYFGPLLSGTVQALPIIHIHAAVFVAWLLLVITQAALAATGRMALHIRIGEVGLYFGLGVIAVGIITAFALFAARIEAGHVQEAQDRLFVPLTDLMVFAPFFAAAWLCKRRPEIHKRLIIVATTILLIAAVHRMTFLGPRPVAAPTLLAVWLAPIYLGMTADLIKRRIVHPVYLAGIAAILYLKFLRVPLFQSDAWKGFAEWLTTFYV